MKKNLLIYGALVLSIFCLGTVDQKRSAVYFQGINKADGTEAGFGNGPLRGSLVSLTEVNTPNAFSKEIIQDKPNYVLIEVVPDLMKYDTDTFSVMAGEKVILELDNLDGMQHNLLIAKPGTLEEVGAAADELLRDPKAAEKQYIPQIPEVLFATELLDPGEMATLEFTAPSEPGDYPFVCTFPGHWRMMNGIMKVEKKSEEG